MTNFQLCTFAIYYLQNKKIVQSIENFLNNNNNNINDDDNNNNNNIKQMNDLNVQMIPPFNELIYDFFLFLTTFNFEENGKLIK